VTDIAKNEAECANTARFLASDLKTKEAALKLGCTACHNDPVKLEICQTTNPLQYIDGNSRHGCKLINEREKCWHSFLYPCNTVLVGTVKTVEDCRQYKESTTYRDCDEQRATKIKEIREKHKKEMKKNIFYAIPMWTPGIIKVIIGSILQLFYTKDILCNENIILQTVAIPLCSLLPIYMGSKETCGTLMSVWAALSTIIRVHFEPTLIYTVTLWGTIKVIVGGVLGGIAWFLVVRLNMVLEKDFNKWVRGIVEMALFILSSQLVTFAVYALFE